MNLVIAMPRLASNAATIALVPPEVLMSAVSLSLRSGALGRPSPILREQIVPDRRVCHPHQDTIGTVGHNRVHALATWRSYGRTHGRFVRGVPLRPGVGRNVLRARSDPARVRVGLRRAANAGRR